MTREELVGLCSDEVGFSPQTTPPGTYFVGTHGIGRVERWADDTVFVVGWRGVWDPNAARSQPPSQTQTADGSPLCWGPSDYEDLRVSIIPDGIEPPAPTAGGDPVSPATLTGSGSDKYDVLYEAWFGGLPSTVRERWQMARSAQATEPELDPAALLLRALIAAYDAGRPVARAIPEARAMLGLLLEGDSGGKYGPLLDPVHEVGKALDG